MIFVQVNDTIKFQEIWMVPKGCFNGLGVLYWPA